MFYHLENGKKIPGITASAESDTICHGEGNFFIACSLDSDGSRDRIDCGDGNLDTARINTSVDKDVAVNCEIIQAG